MVASVRTWLIVCFRYYCCGCWLHLICWYLFLAFFGPLYRLRSGIVPRTTYGLWPQVTLFFLFCTACFFRDGDLCHFFRYFFLSATIVYRPRSGIVPRIIYCSCTACCTSTACCTTYYPRLLCIVQTSWVHWVLVDVFFLLCCAVSTTAVVVLLQQLCSTIIRAAACCCCCRTGWLWVDRFVGVVASFYLFFSGFFLPLYRPRAGIS